jgi:hypothetical protein
VPLHLVVRDAKGGIAGISTCGVFQADGVIHVVDRAAMPNRS